jgi:hypothetical protein
MLRPLVPAIPGVPISTSRYYMQSLGCRPACVTHQQQALRELPPPLLRHGSSPKPFWDLNLTPDRQLYMASARCAFGVKWNGTLGANVQLCDVRRSFALTSAVLDHFYQAEVSSTVVIALTLCAVLTGAMALYSASVE